MLTLLCLSVCCVRLADITAHITHKSAGGPWFNLFNLGGKSEAEMKKLKLNEIKNGRLSMLAVFGYGAQVCVCMCV